MSRCIPSINPTLPIPELIKILKHSTREGDFLEVQSILIDREKKTRIEIENAQMGHDSALHKLAGQEKSELEEKLKRSRRKCKVLNEEIASLYYEIGGLKQGKEESAKAFDELREKKRESDELAKLYECSFEARIMKVEGFLAKMLNLKVEDLAKLKAENLDFDSGDINLVRSQTEDDDDDGAQSGESTRVEPHASGKITVVAEAGDVNEIHDDSDDEVNQGYKTHVSDTSSEQINKRKGIDCTGVSPLNLIRKTKQRICLIDKEEDKETPSCDNSQTPLQSVDSADSDGESSYSDGYMENLVATIRKIR